MNRNKLFVLAVAVCLIAILSFSSLAWFNAKDSVTNEFHVADSNMDADKLFSVTMMEGVDVNGDGVFNPNDGDYTEFEGVTYEKILPGSQLSKRPQAKNTGSYDQFIRVNVTVNNYGTWAAILENGDTVESLWLDTLDTANWVRYYDGQVDGDTITYTYYYQGTLAPAAVTPKLFTEVEIPTYLDQADMALLTGGEFAVDVVAEAIQTENLGTTDVYDAFKVVFPTTPDKNP